MAAARIDTHHHILPPEYMRLVGEAPVARTLVSGRAPAWSPMHSLDVMESNGIATAVTSISAPGFVCGAAEVAPLCRACNEFAARMRADHPGRFGSFASLPLPDIDASLREIAYAFDELGADGLCLLTNYAGVYLGDAAFDPVMAELDRRRAVVFVHPTEGPCACLNGLPPASLEFPFDTTRAVANLLFSGSLDRHHAIRFVFSHAGGAIPFLADRLARLERRPEYKAQVPDGVAFHLRRLFYDTALSTSALTMRGLIDLVGEGQILFGSDYPHAPADTTAGSIASLAKLDLAPDALRRIEGDNARALLPNLARAG